ncbi:MAG: bifunctional (p)ppGpp synthetase/guanosine-3',5'-bis(diphosphate) 3'-pyrophosphohydrolase [Holosporaceae bacterium]|nr:bifunctional (p)ppGpp synthetase/guanosine-3',5'-bis(diphosphate) 3'-pyrophosphohydrolase [Holosporaceae bacterium]
MLTSSELISLVKEYNPDANAELIRKAYIFAMEAHGTQRRASDAPYFYHPLEVARSLAELKFDVSTVVTGLLHDVLEDASVNLEELEEIFGAEIAFLVDGVTKLSKISYVPRRINQAENFQKFLLAISCDIRVLIIKLMDRLSNMRTLNYIQSIEKKEKISLETLEIYAPLAERMGMSIVKDEIEDIAFYNLHPDEYSAISRKLDKIRNKGVNFIANTVDELKKTFENASIDANISGREKKAYSIWKKMQKRNLPLEQINDIIAFRVIVESVQQCYQALGVIHTHFPIVPGRFKDYISVPKINNYKSLHTSVIGSFQQPMEIQIRTAEMHRAAEEGIAAHWFYKSGDIFPGKSKSANYAWTKNLTAILQNAGSPEDIMTHSKLEMFENEVFCFTPRGDLVILPYGATAVDFAYGIHTTVGNTCAGAKINDKIAPLCTVLHNGDQVDIITSPYHHPEAIWESFAISGKAKSNIKKFIKVHEKAEFITLGSRLITYLFSLANIHFTEDSISLDRFSCVTFDEFYYKFGKGIIPLDRVRDLFLKSEDWITICENHLLLTDLLPGIAVHYAECCNPILKDKVIGIFAPPKGLVVHTTSCNRIEKSGSTMVRVKWSDNRDDTDNSFVARLCIGTLNEANSFATITNIISSTGAHIINLKMEHRSVEFFDLLVDIKVRDAIHLDELQSNLRIGTNIRSVRRL